jgi:hypothetical protein
MMIHFRREIMRKFFEKLWEYVTNPTDWRLERYLAASSDAADLEYRQRRWLRMHNWERDHWWLS